MVSFLNFLSVIFFATLYEMQLTAATIKHSYHANSTMSLEKTRYLSLFYSSLQCISSTDPDEEVIREINSNFNPYLYLNDYNNPEDVKLLLEYINSTAGKQDKPDDPFTNSPANIAKLKMILNVLYLNWDNWPLFYNTSVWLINRVNGAQLFWAVRMVIGEKFSDSVLVPTPVEVFPQLFINKLEVAKVAGITFPNTTVEPHPLQYFLDDPGLHDFHVNWHIDNPYYWDSKLYGVKRDRKGELFLYTHHQILQRYNAELRSNGLPETGSLELDPDYAIPEAYYPDVLNINYQVFPPRNEGKLLKDYDDGSFLAQLHLWNDRLTRGIEEGFFLKPDGSPESLCYENASDIAGATIESSLESVNMAYYGSVHNLMHRFLAWLVKPLESFPPGIQSHSETAMRDPVFYRIHSSVDALYCKLKSKFPAYTKYDLDYPDVQIKSVIIQSSPLPNDCDEAYTREWASGPNVITTFMKTESFDISNAARPCTGIGDPPINSETKILDHIPFDYVITLKSHQNSVSHGMVRIFLVPEYGNDGKSLEIDESHQKSILLDLFRIQLKPFKEIIIRRSSLDSTVTRPRSPGIKALYRLTPSVAQKVFQPKMRRSCGYPNNLLIPKGTEKGIKYKLTVMVSEESAPDKDEVDHPNYPYCGSLNGYPYPDKRPMGFPFDRPGTRFTSNGDIWTKFGAFAFKNVYQTPVFIYHQLYGHFH